MEKLFNDNQGQEPVPDNMTQDGIFLNIISNMNKMQEMRELSNAVETRFPELKSMFEKQYQKIIKEIKSLKNQYNKAKEDKLHKTLDDVLDLIKAKKDKYGIEIAEVLTPKEDKPRVIKCSNKVNKSEKNIDDLFKTFAEELENRKLEKSNYGPKGMELYDANKNQERKENNTGESFDNIGQNKNVKKYTSAIQGTAQVQAIKQAAIDKKKSSKNPIKNKSDFTPEQIKAMEDAANTSK